MEGSLVAYKVFTNGSVLQASEINDNLMRQSVMVFSNAAARTAAITVPLEGMITYLEDTNLFYGYNGSAWVNLGLLSGAEAGLVFIANFTAAGVTSVNINSCFSSTFDNYFLTVRGSTATSTAIEYRMRNAGTTDSSANYDSQILEVVSTTVSGSRTVAATSATVGSFRNVETSAHVNFFNPFLTRQTMATATISNPFGEITYAASSSKHRLTTSYDSLTILSTSSMTISGSIYGYAK
jgi:hypothetical protein